MKGLRTMSETKVGYSFTCKVCGNIHIMDEGKPHKGIRVPCAIDRTKVRKYTKNDFTFWHGATSFFMSFVQAKDE